MPPTHPSQAAVAAAYRTLIAHETEPKEQDFYRTRLQRLEQTTEPVCELDCRNRVAAAGVGIYCPQCSAKSADTDLTTQLAKAMCVTAYDFDGAWEDARIDHERFMRYATAALEFLTSINRLIPAGGMALTAEQVEDVRTVLNKFGFNQVTPEVVEAIEAAERLKRALFPATEPAEEVEEWTDIEDVPVGLIVKGRAMIWKWDGTHPHRRNGGGWTRESCDYANRWWPFTPAPAEPAEEETEAEDKWCTGCHGRGRVIVELRGGDIPDLKGPCTNCDGTGLAPAPTETEWQTWQEVPDGVWFTSTSAVGSLPAHRKRGNLVDWQFRDRSVGVYDVSRIGNGKLMARAPFVAAEEG